MDPNLVNMLTECMKVQTVTIKGEVLGREAQIRSEFTKGAQLSKVLFLM